MRSRGLRLTIRGSMVVVALLAVVLAFGIIPLSREIERQNTAREYRQVADGITSAILALEKRVPNGVTRSEWLSAVELTALAHFNTCHRWHPPPLGELYSLRGGPPAEAGRSGGYPDGRVDLGPARVDLCGRQRLHGQEQAIAREMLPIGDDSRFELTAIVVLLSPGLALV